MAFVALTAVTAGAGAQGEPTQGLEGQGGSPPNEQHETGNENGPPPRHAVKTTLLYASDVNADVAGGRSRGAEYLGCLSILFDADLDRLIGLGGAKGHLSFYQIHGNGLSERRVGNLLTVSSIEATRATRINQAWVEFAPAPTVALRVGKFTADQNFMNSATASHFVNGTFGWPGSFSTDLPSGGPAYPLSAPGLRLAIKPVDAPTFQVAVFAGDPAGPGKGAPQRRERHGFNTFRFAGRPFVIAEVGRDADGETPRVSWGLGGWVHFDRFANVSESPAAAAVGSGRSNGSAGHRGNVGGYGFIDAQTWRSATNEKQVARVFLRASSSPPDRNAVDLYVDAGATLAAPLRGRDGDTAGVAFGIARISPALRRSARRLLAAGNPATVPPAYEAVVEASYRAAITGPLQLEPTVQYVIHPAGSALDVHTSGGRLRNAWVLGLRTSITF